jgi:hypothetical protein
MMRLLASVSIGVLLFSAAGAIYAQEMPSTPREVTDSETEGKILAQVEQVIQQAGSLRLVENRLRLQTRAAALLWPYKQARASALLKEVLDSFRAWMTAFNQADPDYQENLNIIANLRNELLQDMIKCDAKLALAFLRATARQADASNAAQANQEASQEMYLASQLAEKDPKEALRIAEEGLSKGLLNGVAQILDRLRANDRDSSTELATQIIARLRGENLLSNLDAMNMSVLLLTTTRVKNPDPQAAAQDSSRNVIISEDARRDLINLVASAIAGIANVQANNAQALFNAANLIMPEIERYAPAQLAAIRQKKQLFDKASDPNARQWRKYSSVMGDGTTDSLISAAVKAPPQIKDELYVEAAGKALNNGETERARQIAENISDPQRRAAKIKEVDQRALAQTAEQGDIEGAAQSARMKSSLAERAADLVYLASVATQKKDKTTARKLLDEAFGQIGHRRAENEKEFFWQLQLGHAFSDLDLKVSFELIEGAIGQLDEMMTAAAAINGFGFTWLKDGELKPYGGEPWLMLSRQCTDELSLLAPKDLHRALKAIQLFQRNEVRLFGTLAIAQQALAAKAKEKNTQKPPNAEKAAGVEQ